VSSSILHLSDPHFGGVANLRYIRAVEEIASELEPTVIAVSGDLSQRARHGEYQAARAFLRELERTAPVFVIPGNHDVQWWRRPLIPFGRKAKYGKYAKYFGPIAPSALSLPELLVTSALTSHGIAWGSLTPKLRDLAVKGHLPKKEIQRVTKVFEQADPAQLRVLVVHHNIMRGKLSNRMGLARWKQAQRRIIQSKADVVLCGHDHQESAELLEDKVVVSCAGTLSTRARGGRPVVFNRIRWAEGAIHVELFRWESSRKAFKQSDIYAFAWTRTLDERTTPGRVG
jgi:3',5'-cyclic AMP phosphodiesterase CpdA